MFSYEALKNVWKLSFLPCGEDLLTLYMHKGMENKKWIVCGT